MRNYFKNKSWEKESYSVHVGNEVREVPAIVNNGFVVRPSLVYIRPIYENLTVIRDGIKTAVFRNGKLAIASFNVPLEARF